MSVTEVLDLDNERARRKELLERLLPSTRAESCEELFDMVERRRDSLRALYVGTRSGLLSRSDAKETYLRIEAVEETFRKLLMRKSLDVSNVQELRVHYAKVNREITLPRAEKSDESNYDTQLADEQFAKLHERVRARMVGLHDLEYAPLLRRISDKRLQPLPELLELKHHLWSP
jgi:hypothetical protein